MLKSYPKIDEPSFQLKIIPFQNLGQTIVTTGFKKLPIMAKNCSIRSRCSGCNWELSSLVGHGGEEGVPVCPAQKWHLDIFFAFLWRLGEFFAFSSFSSFHNMSFLRVKAPNVTLSFLTEFRKAQTHQYQNLPKTASAAPQFFFSFFRLNLPEWWLTLSGHFIVSSQRSHSLTSYLCFHKLMIDLNVW